MALAKRSISGGQPVNLWDITTPTNPLLVTTLAWTGAQPGTARAAKVATDVLAVWSYQGFTYNYRVTLFDYTTGTALDDIGGPTEVSDSDIAVYTADGRNWVLHCGSTVGTGQNFTAREVVAGAFVTDDNYVQLTADGTFSKFVLVDNYIYGVANSKSGLVTYRIEEL
jgi:hypothetical protein